MITVEEALGHVLSLADATGTEIVDIGDAAGRVLAEPVAAARDNPPFAASAMDGYAARGEDASPGNSLEVIGEAAAGRAWDGLVAAGQAVRIFTGAPIPRGATRVVIQEDVTRDGDRIILGDGLDGADHIRPAGGDFKSGDTLDAPRRLGPAELALAAAMNAPSLTVARRPIVSLIATGDELVMPGDDPAADQIVASNTFGLKAMLADAGAEPRMTPIARDDPRSLAACFDLASSADLVVTVGGASVGDHDIVAEVGAERGLLRDFHKVAMRPGKPLMAGRINGTPMVGLPGNPVSALVCGLVFLVPMIHAMLGLPSGPLPRASAALARDLPANGPREHYMRARAEPGGTVRPFDRQDSSLLGVLAAADALVVRPPFDPARTAGEAVDVIYL